MLIRSEYLNRLLSKKFDVSYEAIGAEELAEIENLVIEEEIDFSDLVFFTNLKELKIYNLEVTMADLDMISKIASLKELYFTDCEIESLEGLVDTQISTLYFYNSLVEDLYYINNFPLKELYLENMGIVDLDNISIIRNLETLSLNDTKILNEQKLIFLDAIVNLSLSGTEIKSIDTLVANESLKCLVVDDEIIKNNLSIISVLKGNGVKVVNEKNQEVESYYD